MNLVIDVWNASSVLRATDSPELLATVWVAGGSFRSLGRGWLTCGSFATLSSIFVAPGEIVFDLSE